MNTLNHVAFIMDGNGRWGKKRNKSRNYGHLQGVKAVQKIVEASLKLKIPIITFYVFSTENWKRPKKEVNFLFNLIGSYFKKEIDNVMNNNLRINIIGNRNLLPNTVKKILNETVQKTKKNKKLLINLALNYGSKSEITSSIAQALNKKEKITEKSIKKYLFTKNMPDPDILIRTGGHQRLSNFMLWQLAYAELYFLYKLCPEFNEKDLKKIIKNFNITKRNFGSI
jgi:undecaprenyl diphosphate synthase